MASILHDKVMCKNRIPNFVGVTHPIDQKQVSPVQSRSGQARLCGSQPGQDKGHPCLETGPEIDRSPARMCHYPASAQASSGPDQVRVMLDPAEASQYHQPQPEQTWAIQSQGSPFQPETGSSKASQGYSRPDRAI